MKKIVVTGSNGLLGQALQDVLQEKYQVLCTSVEPENYKKDLALPYWQQDLADRESVLESLKKCQPDFIVNAAAFTHVDACETKKDLCRTVNYDAVKILSDYAVENNVHLVHISTDYVFNGSAGPYAEMDATDPIGYYGETKLDSENYLLENNPKAAILRTNVLYGIGYQVKLNFFLWVLKCLKDNKPMTIVTDQYNNPTLAEDLATGCLLAIEQAASGIFHISGKEYINRFDFAQKIAQVFNYPLDGIKPILTKDLNQAADRPLRGGLKINFAEKELNYIPRSTEEALNYLKEKMGNYDETA